MFFCFGAGFWGPARFEDDCRRDAASRSSVLEGVLRTTLHRVRRGQDLAGDGDHPALVGEAELGRDTDEEEPFICPELGHGGTLLLPRPNGQVDGVALADFELDVIVELVVLEGSQVGALFQVSPVQAVLALHRDGAGPNEAVDLHGRHPLELLGGERPRVVPARREDEDGDDGGKTRNERDHERCSAF